MATVSIATLTGENGIISKAREAKEQTEKANIKEQVQLAILGSYDQYRNLDYEVLRENLNNIEGITGVPVTITDSSFPLTLNLDGYDIAIQKNGTVTVEGGSTSEEDTPEVYTITYDENGGDANSVPHDQTVTEGERLKLTTTSPTRAGYDFKGWCTHRTATLTDVLYQPGQAYNFTSNVKLYAIWEIQALTFSNGREIQAERGAVNITTKVDLPTLCMVYYTVDYNVVVGDNAASYTVSGAITSTGGKSDGYNYTSTGESTDSTRVDPGEFIVRLYTTGSYSSITFRIDRIVNLDTNEEYNIE